MGFSRKEQMINIIDKFGKRLFIERNLGNQCLMIWGRHIQREDITKFIAWLKIEWGINDKEIYKEVEQLTHK